MILAARARPGAAQRPWIVWLHGFLGSRDEWLQLSDYFTSWPQLFIDLPGHGASSAPDQPGFAPLSARLDATLEHYAVHNYWLVGYSLGGRCAMYHTCFGHRTPRGLVVEGAHPGLSAPECRKARLIHDEGWAQRLIHEPLPTVLDDWYRQPVFAHLSAVQRRELVALRSRGDGEALAMMLRATSLGCQPDLRAALSALTCPFYYFYGEWDTRFAVLARTLPALPIAIPAVGHNAHRESPAQFAEHLLKTVLHFDEDQP